MAGQRSIVGVLAGVGAGTVTVHQERCAKVRNRNVACLKCAEACTSGCISLVDGVLAVDGDKCVGCGTCATVCPTCALEARNPSDSQLLQACLQARKGDTVVVACEQLRCAAEGFLDEGRVARVVCLGRVDESLASGLAVQGVREVVLACGDCSQCEQQHGLATAQLVADTSNMLFETWGSDARVAVEQGVSACPLVEDADAAAAARAVEAYFRVRRGNARVRDADAAAAANGDGSGAGAANAGCDDRIAGAGNAGGAGASAAAGVRAGAGLDPALVRVMRDGTLPHFIPDRRERLLDDLSALGEPNSETLSSRLWGCVVIDGSKCSSCRMCATFCPTGAIRKFDLDDGTFGVDHVPGDCVKCGSCRDVCEEDAILLLDNVRPAFLLGGAVHHYVMKPRPVELGDAQQIVNTMRERMRGSDIFER